MTNKEYKELVEAKYGKSLKEVMYELCVDRRLDKWDGAKILDVPEKTFVAWRTQFRFGPDQLRYDQAVKMRIERINEYKKQLENINLRRKFTHNKDKSLKGFRELIERKMELEKLRRTLLEEEDSLSDMSVLMRIGMLEGVLDYLDEYEKHEENIEARFLKEVEMMELFLNREV
ncbi:hypothetical protein [Paenibacillus polymyxa]|uniref:Uncharacterized protein n=1 Tax=Paenibacillus polymyxa TaxID=1406 RepID=A0A378Y1Y6_PAEPO|nr:hypothetical protein [Paenibacillus polymyxa]MBE7901190.1 hypothetical protein [Paenibacillus polymyxa]MCC3261744.1 hypothetical protein [Paenibacillus polymyxa]MDN4086201.1 hypothetical protein [Paenibacillus polymyxa]MDN4088525.1 hypothetical protein [Paenibacillus polymyxa]MDN4107976.1 hypothetical protein [Paenibacillus polymyxa]